ncbi:MAG TPA: M3 family oligoendopeptidase [Candidatus Dormibacteraeota bacterium]|nr:M3 family oligoendopeptidase [Candidatus Dormibacteraeota bacterium]
MLKTTDTTGAEDVTWDLTELFASPSDPAIESVFAASLKAAVSFEQKYRGRLAALSPVEFAAMLEELEDSYEAGSKPAIYAHLLHTQDTTDAAAGRLFGRVRDAEAERGRHMVFFSLELADLTDEVANALYDHPASARYRHTIEEARKYRSHQMTEPEERLLTERVPVGMAAWVRLFEELCAGIKADFRGTEMPLVQVLALQREPDRELRRDAAVAISGALREGLRTRGYIFNVILQDHAIDDRLRGYPTWISARNLGNETSDEAVQALIEAVTNRNDIAHRYYRVKKKLLGLDQLFDWDRYAPVGNASRDLSWSEAVELVTGSYQRFSPKAGRLVQDFLDHGWVDAALGEGKEGGAYCMASTPRHHPYVMMNFTGKLNDALTLAHELGHGLHDRLAARQHLFDYHPPLTLAETASVFGETLTFDRIMAEEHDPGIRLAMLCGQLEGSFATIFRQVAMNRFEHEVHTRRRSEGELSVDQLGDVWQLEIQRMFGDSLTLTDDHRVWWSYVEHFVHTPGYVYAYAFGNLLALSVYRRYQEVGPSFVDDYFEFLSAGGSRRPDELVRSLGMDITSPGFWDSGLVMLDEMVSEVERLAQVNAGER